MQHKVLITGVAGLIGSHMAEYLIHRGYDVYGVDDLSGGYYENIPRSVSFYCDDISDKKAIARVFKRVKPDYVYHFAAYAAEGLSPFIRNFNFTNNLVGSTNIINECIKNDVKKLIFTSSMAVYGEGKPPFKETDTPHPIDPYGIAKFGTELDLECASAQFGLKYSIVRPHNVIGIRQNIWDKYRNVLGIWIRRVLKGQSICIFGDGTQERAFSDITFYLEPFEKLMFDYDSEIFNLGCTKQYSLNEVAQTVKKVAKELGLEATIEHLDQRTGEAKYAYSSHSKAEKMLEFKDETNIENVVRSMFKWAKNQPDREVKQMEYEIDKGMYSYWKMELNELLTTPRMGHAPLSDVNSVAGLYEIIKTFFKPDFKIVEIGSFQGVSTILFSKFVQTVYSVDCYDYVVPATGRIPTHDQLFVDAEKIFLERTKDIQNIVKIRKSSLEAAQDFKNKSLDAVYIDAEHDEDSVRADIKAWRPKIKFGGYLCGHDYYLPHIEKILKEEGFQKITIAPDSSWIVKIPTVTLVSVACTKVPETLHAMNTCLEKMEFNRAILITSQDVHGGNIEVINIDPLDYKQYNEFVAMKLWEHIDTDFALLVQNDGYITDETQWDDVFLNFDYIGAPWPPETHYAGSVPGSEVRVGNGGFSLRSTRLLKAPTELGLTFTDKGTGFWHEDGFLCVHYREELEKAGIKFAPVGIAAKFSTELIVPETTQSFGKHKYL